MLNWMNSEMFINAINIIAAHFVIYFQAIIIVCTLISLSLIIYFVGLHSEVIPSRTPNYISEEVDSSEDSERKLFLVTKFNTYVNKIMPAELEHLVKKTYDKIYGRDSKRFYPKMISAERTAKKRKRVSFVEQTIEYEI